MTPEETYPKAKAIQNVIHITAFCHACGNRLEAYADNLKVALGSLDNMKEELTFHMENGDCKMPSDHPPRFINPTPPPAKRRTPADVEIYRKELSDGES